VALGASGMGPGAAGGLTRVEWPPACTAAPGHDPAAAHHQHPLTRSIPANVEGAEFFGLNSSSSDFFSTFPTLSGTSSATRLSMESTTNRTSLEEQQRAGLRAPSGGMQLLSLAGQAATATGSTLPPVMEAASNSRSIYIKNLPSGAWVEREGNTS
jgi:hypothetical protein